MSLVPTQEPVHALPADRPWLHHIVETSEAILAALDGLADHQLSHVLLMERLPPTLPTGVLAAAIQVLIEEDLVVTFPASSGVEPGHTVMMVALSPSGRAVLATRADARRATEVS